MIIVMNRKDMDQVMDVTKQPKQAKVSEVGTYENGYLWKITADDGEIYFLTPRQVVGKPEIGTSGTIQYKSTSTRGGFYFSF